MKIFQKKYQDTLYNWYAPNYKIDENRIIFLLDIDEKQITSEIDLKRAYKRISTFNNIISQRTY